MIYTFYLVQSIVIPFIFPLRPSSLDAVFFAHLAQVNEYPTVYGELVEYYPSLNFYFDSIMKHYFSAARGEPTSDNQLAVDIVMLDHLVEPVWFSSFSPTNKSN